jgi:hypothetical protein
MEEHVSFASHSQAIAGVLHVPDQPKAPGIIMCHGFTGNKSEAHRLFVAAARDLCAHGIAVLRFDFRGSGDSAGEFREMTISGEVADAVAALSYLISRPEVDGDRVGVLGLSLGGCVAACLAGRDQRVRALVLWAATAHPERIGERLASELGAADVLDFSGWGLGRGFIEDAAGVRPLSDAARYLGPALVVHGEKDQAVPVADARDYEKALGGAKTVHVIPEADHVFSSLLWTAEAVGASRDFLLRTLGKR